MQHSILTRKWLGIPVLGYGMVVVVGLAGGLLGSVLSTAGEAPPSSNFFSNASPERPVRLAASTSAGVDFAAAAERSAPSVVFVRTVSQYQRPADPFWGFWDFFGRRSGPITSAGSGVIVNPNGYIVTNYHVIDQADNITVSLTNKHTYQAKVVGTDPNTDLALLKIDVQNLPAITLANSDEVRIGDWVLAVGNPLNLTSTVTAGIVSAKGRNINILNSQFPIESFIQTDAAINPGNSGGALVNERGELIGINTAIKSETGAYSGYGFAIPVNIVRKVIADLIDHGAVQQAFLEADVLDIDESLADRLPDGDFSGVFINDVNPGGAAAKAGLRGGDILLKINNYPVDSRAEYYERLAYLSPGDKAVLTVKRGGETISLPATLTNRDGGTGVLENTTVTVPEIGADVTPLSRIEKQRYGVDAGYRLTNVKRGIVSSMGLQDGFVILKINNVVPESVAELAGILKNLKGRIFIEGLNANGTRARYSFQTF